MASKGKKISELTALTSASLQTTLVGVDNGYQANLESCKPKYCKLFNGKCISNIK